MITIKFKPCCNNCGNRETYVNDTYMNVDDRRMNFSTEIGCKHEEVCKEYREETEK